MSSIVIDKVDTGIIQALQKDSRTSLKEISRLVGISVPTARARIQRLEDLGVIKRFTVAIDPQKLVGGITVLLHLDVKLPNIKAVGERLSQMEEVTETYLTTGEYDVVAKICVPDMRSLEEFIAHKLSEVPGIEHAHSSIIVETLKELYGPVLRPGFGIRLSCYYCKREIAKDPVRKTINEREYYFCCDTCASTYQQRFIKS
ncbi:Lrp/AsnC ligand binding domain-containing protein [Candidatus Hecatella orcuttiae]|jgi:DNA-binding Lrp family transcriptional regulator|uniref:Lrp/AsnC ligand binding domain-containing protein n=1 Tax=Candidatus Hecatella orcuttiae TaxID=1935119 RepID=UPI002867F2E0|nr:Lrp/AsnC ligand binding domain-containing protein [Candidatus Hecatella orcuttiae]